MFFTTIPNCPPSLKLLIQVYRIYGFSFSCIGFNEKANRDGYFYKLRSNLPRLIFFIFHLFVVVNVCYTAAYNTYYNFADPRNWSNGSVNNFEEYLRQAVQKYRSEYIVFKPILRIILQSVLVVFIADNGINYPLSFITGGKLIKNILQIPNIHSFDRNLSFALKLLACPPVCVLLSYFGGFLLFQWKQISIIWKQITLNELKFDFSEFKTFLSPAISYSPYFTVQSIGTIFYIYSMTMIRQNIQKLEAELQENLDDQQLNLLKNKLKHLQRIFVSIKSNLSLPLTWVSITNIYIIISSVCYLIIIPNKEHYFSAVVCSYLAYVLGRLFALGWAGDLPASAMESLIIKTYEKIDVWTLDRWMTFKEIRKLEKPFQSNIWGVYTIDQSTILTALGFALGYIVVLLQTESFAAETLPK